MLKHIPDDGIHSQLDALADCVASALVELDQLAYLDHAGAMRPGLGVRIATLNLLWQTYEVLAGNFEQVSRQAIENIAQLQVDGLLTKAVADKLMLPFEEALGQMYVYAMAVPQADAQQG